MRNKEDIRERLLGDLEDIKATLDLWRDVKITSKKDGTPFADINRNFINARYLRGDGFLEHEKLIVDGYGTNRKYVKDSIDCYLLVEYMAEDDNRKQQANPKQTYIKQIYTLTFDEIVNAIDERIEYLNYKIKHYTEQLERLNVVFDTINDKVKELKDDIHTMTKCKSDGDYDNTLYYAMREYCKEQL